MGAKETFAQSTADQDFSSAVQKIQGQFQATMANECPNGINGQAGSGTCLLMTTLQGNCIQLAGGAGGIQEGVLNGETTYQNEAAKADEEKGPDASLDEESTYLAEQAAPGTSPGQLVISVYDRCMALIKQ